jgi:hypothetical protein
MVERDAVQSFGRAWMDEYRGEFPAAARRAQCFRSAIGPGARRLD